MYTSSTITLGCVHGTISLANQGIGINPVLVIEHHAIDYVEEIVRLPSGDLRYRRLSLSRVSNHAGKMIGVVSVVRDITKSKQVVTEGIDLLRRIKVAASDLIQQSIKRMF